MKLDACTPENLCAQITEIREDEEWSTDMLYEEMHRFGLQYNNLGIVSEDTETLLTSVIPGDEGWFYFELLHFIFQQEQDTKMEADTVYEGEAYVEHLQSLKCNELRFLISLSQLFALDPRDVDDETVAAMRHLLVVHAFFLLEDTDFEDDDDDDDDDGGGDHFSTDTDVSPGGTTLDVPPYVTDEMVEPVLVACS